MTSSVEIISTFRLRAFQKPRYFYFYFEDMINPFFAYLSLTCITFQGVEKLLCGGTTSQTPLPTTTFANPMLAMFEHQMCLGMKYRDDCMSTKIQATLMKRPTYVPVCTKQILFFRVNDVVSYGFV